MFSEWRCNISHRLIQIDTPTRKVGMGPDFAKENRIFLRGASVDDSFSSTTIRSNEAQAPLFSRTTLYLE